MQYRGLKVIFGLVCGMICALGVERTISAPGMLWVTLTCGVLSASNFWYAVRTLTRP